MNYFNLLFLIHLYVYSYQVMNTRCDVVVQYVDVVSRVLEQTLTLTCVPAQLLAVSLLANTLAGLSNNNIKEYRNTTHEWEEPFTEFLPVKV